MQTKLPDNNQPEPSTQAGLSTRQRLLSEIQTLQNRLNEQPRQARLHFSLSERYQKLGNHALQTRHLLAACHCDPNQPEYQYHLALLLKKEGRYTESCQALKKALRINPRLPAVHFQLGNTYACQNQWDLAQVHYETAEGLGLHTADLACNLGLIYYDQAEYRQALPRLKWAFEADPKLSLGLCLAETYLKLGQTAEATSCYLQLLEQNPHCPTAHHNLAILYTKAQNLEQALTHFSLALQQAPDNPTAKHMLAALSKQSDKPSHPPRLFVEALFDQYADYYDQDMQQLQNQAPITIRNALAPFLSSLEVPIRTLDLGCGTGQLGVYCRDFSFTLWGLDVSEQMIKQAQTKGVYDKLIQADISDFLRHTSEKMTVIMASEVFGYLGDLKPFFPLFHRALVQNGLLAFSIELPQKPSSQSSAFTLTPSGRYTHSETHLVAHIQATGLFKVEHSANFPLRQSAQGLLQGQVFVLRAIDTNTHLAPPD